MRIGMITIVRGPHDNALERRRAPLLREIGCETYLITSDFFGKLPAEETQNNHKIEKKSLLKCIFRYIMMQINISKKIFENSGKLDILMFYVGNDLLFPLIISKILGKHTVLVTAGSASESLRVEGTHHNSISMIFSKLFSIVEGIGYTLCDNIIVYTKSCIEYFGLGNHRNKILIAHDHFLDIGKFKPLRAIDSRETIIGYVGRLSGEKGVLNLADAIQLMSYKINNFKIIIIGDGKLRKIIEKQFVDRGLKSKIIFLGQIPHSELPAYLNEFKLLILPSYTEGLPNVISEAMSCGTPVLVTPVGGTLDIIKDEETGFIMDNNSPECIAKNIIRVLEYKDLNKIVRNARALIEREFTYEKAVERWREIIENI